MSTAELQKFESRMSLVVTQAIQWGDMDSYAHVNNTVYFRYFENARLKWFQDKGISSMMENKKIGPILGSTDCRFMAPLTYPDDISIGLNITDLKEKRFTILYEIFSHSQNRTVATGTGIIVYFDYNAQKSCAVPASIVDAIH